MWLPNPVYESLPYVYVAIGLLFISGATYIGFGTGEANIYLGTGVISVLVGVLLYKRRTAARAQKKATGSETPESESTT